MSARFDCADPAQLLQGLAEAETALRRGELVVIPTDTVYGIAAEAFDPVAVDGLLKAKGRGRDMPPPVLVGTVRAAMALVMELGDAGKDLIDEFWPGALTIVCMSSPTLVWDLGETKGTVAVRMPLHQVALDLLKRTGPLAVSSANVSGRPPATTADEAMAQLGDSVAVYLDGGPCAADVASTIVDLTGTVPRLLRQGVISEDRLRAVIPLAVVDDDEPEDAGDAPGAVAEDAGDAPGAVAEDAGDAHDGVRASAGEAVPPVGGDEMPPDAGDGVAPGAGDQVAEGPGDTADGAEQGNHAHRDAAG
jgi:tRNA threonylcarbamoyl adenosine modification protein (Sua5/YciO/YrdC/YwlC family)